MNSQQHFSVSAVCGSMPQSPQYVQWFTAQVRATIVTLLFGCLYLPAPSGVELRRDGRGASGRSGGRDRGGGLEGAKEGVKALSSRKGERVRHCVAVLRNCCVSFGPGPSTAGPEREGHSFILRRLNAIACLNQLTAELRQTHGDGATEPEESLVVDSQVCQEPRHALQKDRCGGSRRCLRSSTWA